MTDHVILVNENDQEVGTMEKLQAHREGLLHRAFSILIFNNKGELLLQKRAQGKYHSGGLWTNTCCSHPIPNELIEVTTHRRLREEMGLDSKLEFAYKFLYKAQLDNNLTEHELDYVFIGTSDDLPTLNKSEAEDWKFVSMDWLKKDVAENPHHYTYWFRLIINHPEFLKLAA